MEFQAQLEQSLSKLGAQVEEKIKAANAQSEEKMGAKFMAELKDLSAKFKETQDELTDLAQKSAASASAAAKAQGTMGSAFVASDGFKAFASGAAKMGRFEYQANTITGETSSNPNRILSPFERMSGIVALPNRKLSVLDFIPRGTTTLSAIEYLRETSFTNDAAETAQAATLPESDLAHGLQTSHVRDIGHFIKVTKQVLDDAPQMQSYIDSRLAYGVRLRLENQIVSGNGTAPNLAGITAAGNSTAIAVGAATNAFDYTNLLKYAVEGADFIADFYFVNPADWGAIERIKKGAGDASYIGGDGAISYANNGLDVRLWGIPVVTSNAVPVGTVICGSREALMLWERQGVTVDISESDGDNFKSNLLTIRANMRAAFTVFHAGAIVRANLATIPAP